MWAVTPTSSFSSPTPIILPTPTSCSNWRMRLSKEGWPQIAGKKKWRPLPLEPKSAFKQGCTLLVNPLGKGRMQAIFANSSCTFQSPFQSPCESINWFSLHHRAAKAWLIWALGVPLCINLSKTGFCNQHARKMFHHNIHKSRYGTHHKNLGRPGQSHLTGFDTNRLEQLNKQWTATEGLNEALE